MPKSNKKYKEPSLLSTLTAGAILALYALTADPKKKKKEKRVNVVETRSHCGTTCVADRKLATPVRRRLPRKDSVDESPLQKPIESIPPVKLNKKNMSLGIESIPVYTGTAGDTTFEEFIEVVETVAAIVGWDDAAKFNVAKLKMEGHARAMIKAKKPTTWADLKKVFKEANENAVPPAQFLLLFLSCHIMAKETVEEYAQRLEKLMLGACPPSTDDIYAHSLEYLKRIRKSVFLNGVFPKLREYLEDYADKPYDEILKAAINKETQWLKRRMNAPVAESSTSSGKVVPDPSLLSMEKLVNAIKKATNNGKSPGQKGRPNPPWPKKQNTAWDRPYEGRREQRRCYFCNRVGHLIKDCFRKPGNNRYRQNQYDRNPRQRNFRQHWQPRQERQNSYDKYDRRSPPRQPRREPREEEKPRFRKPDSSNNGKWQKNDKRVNTIHYYSESDSSCSEMGSLN